MKWSSEMLAKASLYSVITYLKMGATAFITNYPLKHERKTKAILHLK